MKAKGFDPTTQIPLAYSSTAIACMISPFFVGMVADRFFATQKVMATLHFLGAIFAIAAVLQTSFILFFTFLLLHTICYMPTLPLANSLSFKQLKNPSEQFPTIRVFGSLGWIAAGFIISLLHYDKSAGMFYMTASFGVAMAVYCMTLPHTPPDSSGKKPSAREILGLDALTLLKDRNVLIFMLGSFLTCIPLTFYFNELGMYLSESGIEKIGVTMTIGQWVEAGFFLIMPIMLRELGIKKVLLLGMLCWALRLSCFGHAVGTTGSLLWMIIFGIALHGMAYDFFFVSGQIYIDRRAPKEIRSSAQGLLYFLTLGAGMFVGSLVVAAVNNHYSTEIEQISVAGSYLPVVHFDWASIWYVAASMSAIVFLLFALAFRDKEAEAGVNAHTRKPMKAWAVVGGIVAIMFILSFSLQSYLLSTSTCAGLWDSEKARAEITTETSNDENTTETSNDENTTETSKDKKSIITGSFILTLKDSGDATVYHVGKIDNMEGTVDADGKHHVNFEVSVRSGKAEGKIKNAGGEEVDGFFAPEIKKGQGTLIWTSSGQEITYSFGTEESFTLKQIEKTYQKK